MSAGVATTFRDHFGKPRTSDCISNDLTFQNRGGGCSVYGLVTKKNYFDKPTEDNYSEAFQALTKSFKTKKFMSLVCSPAGCIRDGISPDIFLRNLVTFQNETSAPVNVIILKKAYNPKLKNGFTYKELVLYLQNKILELNSGTFETQALTTQTSPFQRNFTWLWTDQ